MDIQSPTLRERRKGTAVWKQIEQALMKQIMSGEIAPGGRLPSETALADAFSVNRHTVRRALAELASQKMVRVENGRGAFVPEDFVNYWVGASSRFWESLLRDGHSASIDLMSAVEIPASTRVAQALGLNPGGTVIAMESLGKANGQPVVLACHSFSKTRFPDFADRYRAEGSIRKALATYGITASRKTVKVSARLPSDEEVSAFLQPWPQPVLIVESTYVDDGGAVVDHGVARYASARVQLDIEL